MWPLGSPRLRRIVLAYSVNEMGRWFALIALSWAVYEHTHSSLALAAVIATPLLPALLAPAVVARVESSPRRGQLSMLYAIEAVSATGLAACLWRFSLPGILILLMVDGGVSYAARGLLRAEAARDAQQGEDKADDRSIHRINATLNVCLALTSVAGPALAGLSLDLVGAPVSLLIDAACLTVCGVLVIQLRPYVEEAGASIRSRLAAARTHLRERSGLGALLVTEAVAVVFFTCAVPIEVLYVKNTLQAGEAGYGALVAVWGVGMVAGSILFARAGAGSARGGRPSGPVAMLCGGTLAVGLCYLGFAFAPNLRVACVAALLGGLGNGVQWAALLETVQRLTPGPLLGRMMGAIEGIGGAAPVLGYALGGVLAALVEPRVALLVAGGAATALTLAFLRISAGLLHEVVPPAAEVEPGPPPQAVFSDSPAAHAAPSSLPRGAPTPVTEGAGES